MKCWTRKRKNNTTYVKCEKQNTKKAPLPVAERTRSKTKKKSK